MNSNNTSGRSYKNLTMGKKQLKKVRKLKPSSQKWVLRQLNDPFVKQAKMKGYRSRAAIKLEQMDNKYFFLKPHMKVVDLGSAPGGWLQIVYDRCLIYHGKGLLVGVDILDIEPLPKTEIIKGDFSKISVLNKVLNVIKNECDLVLSDMAATTTGHKKTDHLRTSALFELAFDFAQTVLVNEGTFVAKIFRGISDKMLDQKVKEKFSSVRFVKPKASRDESVETYMLATGFKK